ncbi:MAG: hypothetical protein EOP84_33500 [Verrucomicrobiaceae bacterium]|nr:MAG: hypothetical protein EOP84_33500 [Verrucomicrobiaceae bacterium]
MKWHELIKVLVERDGGELRVAKAMGKPSFQSTLYKITHGSVTSPKRESAERIAGHYRIDVNALYDDRVAEKEAVRLDLLRPGSKGWVLISGPTSQEDVEPAATVPEPLPAEEKNIDIKQYDTGGGMGGGLVLRDQPGVIQNWRVTEEWIQKNVKGFSAARNLCIVTGFGDSMRPMFNPGDPLLVDIGVTSVEFDSVYFFRETSKSSLELRSQLRVFPLCPYDFTRVVGDLRSECRTSTAWPIVVPVVGVAPRQRR